MTGTEIAETQSRQPKTPIIAGGLVRAIIPQTYEDAFRVAVGIYKANIAPAELDSPEKIMAVVMYGLEIGLPPMQSVNKIAIINGRPLIWGDAALSLVRASGLSEYVKEWSEGEGEQTIAYCEAKRKDTGEIIKGEFSVDDAKIAQLWSTEKRVTRFKRDGSKYEKDNDSPWHRFWKRMLKMRARAFCLRDGFADVLGGLYLKEEFDGEQEREEELLAPPVPPPPSEIDDSAVVVRKPAEKKPRKDKAYVEPEAKPVIEEKAIEPISEDPPAPTSDEPPAPDYDGPDAGEQSQVYDNEPPPPDESDIVEDRVPAVVDWYKTGYDAKRAGVYYNKPAGELRESDRADDLEKWREGWSAAHDEMKKEKK